MIVLISKNTLKDGCREQFIALAQKMTEETRKEKGCISYDLAIDAEQDHILYFIEKYENEAALEYHRNTEHFRTYVPQFEAFRIKPSELTICTVEG